MGIFPERYIQGALTLTVIASLLASLGIYGVNESNAEEIANALTEAGQQSQTAEKQIKSRDMSIEVLAPTELHTGDEFNYDIRITNTGTEEAARIIAFGHLPINLPDHGREWFRVEFLGPIGPNETKYSSIPVDSVLTFPEEGEVVFFDCEAWIIYSDYGVIPRACPVATTKEYKSSTYLPFVSVGVNKPE